MDLDHRYQLKTSFKPCFVFLLVQFLIFSCNFSQENGKNGSENMSEFNLLTTNAWQKSGDMVQKITLSPKGIVRNQIWGVLVDSLKENIELSENQAINGKSYTLYFDDSDLNFADISYIKDRTNKLTEIDFDIFVEKKQQVDELKEKLIAYLNIKFGASNLVEKQIIWEKDKNTRIVLEDVSSTKDPGIKLIFSKIN
jgi:hypothetical protein